MFVTVPACLCLFIGLYVNKRLDGIDMIDLTELAENAVIFRKFVKSSALSLFI